ncbi:DUF58 domain-containing protein [Candidatus Woesearchaeota archaeon]|nr:DUF58 domain-containing protein [Candidatus Woesearchaeota archaeon]
MHGTKQVLKKVKKIEIKTRRLVDGLLQGAYHSVFRGRGVEFSEVREYVPGDDIRTIDWNVTARMNQPFVKEFIEERDLTVYIVLDISASSEFGSEKSKKQAAVELAASLMFAALRNNDRTGLLLFTKEVEKFIPPKKGKRHILKLIREMVEFRPKSRKTDLSGPLAFLAKVAKKRSIAFIISDFYSSNYEKQLKLLKNRHDVVAINVNDIREHEIPDIGYIELEDEETGEQLLLDTSDKEFRNSYARQVDKKNRELKKALTRLKIDLVQLSSEIPFEVPLRKFFRARQRRMAR